MSEVINEDTEIGALTETEENKEESNDNKEKSKLYSQVQVRDMILEKLKTNEDILQNYEKELNNLSGTGFEEIKKKITELETIAAKANFFGDIIKKITNESPSMEQLGKIINEQQDGIKTIKNLYKATRAYLTHLEVSTTVKVNLKKYSPKIIKLNLDNILKMQKGTECWTEQSIKSAGSNFSNGVINESEKKDNDATSEILAQIYWALDYASEKEQETSDSLKKFEKGAKITMGIGGTGVATTVGVIAASAIQGTAVAGVTASVGATVTSTSVAVGGSVAATGIVGSAILATGVIGAGILTAGLVGYGIFRLIKWITSKKKK